MNRRPYRGEATNHAFRSLRLPSSPFHVERYARKHLTTLEAVKRFIETSQDVSALSGQIQTRLGPTSKARRTKTAMSQCDKDARCGVVLCPKCARTYRVWIASQALALSQRGVPAKTLVILIREVDAADLATVDRRREMDRLRKDLVRCGFTAAIGNLEVTYKPVRKTWSVHAHLLVFGDVDQPIEDLKAIYKSRELGRAVDDAPLRDRVRQITYLFKFVTYYRYEGSPRIYPLSKIQLEQLAVWTKAAKFTDFLFLLGFQRRGSVVSNRGFGDLLP